VVLGARATENGTWYAAERANGTDYRKIADQLGPSAAERAHRATIFVLFSALNTTVEGVGDREEGSADYRVESTGVRNPGTLASQLRVESVENVSLTALVSEEGLVREYYLEYTATLGENTSRVERTVQFTALGETSVERPAWYDEATNSSETGYLGRSATSASGSGPDPGATAAARSARWVASRTKIAAPIIAASAGAESRPSETMSVVAQAGAW
jgi:hypothetical protein